MSKTLVSSKTLTEKDPLKKSIYKSQISNFSTERGEEYFIALESQALKYFEHQAKDILQEYSELMLKQGLTQGTEIFLRFYLSDIKAQAQKLKQIVRESNENAFYFIVGAPPASGSCIGIEAYHIKSRVPIIKEKKSDYQLSICQGQYRFLWGCFLPGAKDSLYRQTIRLFSGLSEELVHYEANIKDNLLRTWVYIKDINNNYQEMVRARCDFLNNIELNERSRFFSSTGVEGDCENLDHLVSMHSLSVKGLAPGQVTFMDSPDYLNHPSDYGVTFERAIRITFGDRSHFYISGTASIDKNGEVLYCGDAQRQSQRSIINIQSLLNRYGADLNDLKLLIVYLRNASDRQIVVDVLAKHMLQDIPTMILQSRICRPSWLVEIEGVAVSAAKNKQFAPFC